MANHDDENPWGNSSNKGAGKRPSKSPWENKPQMNANNVDGDNIYDFEKIIGQGTKKLKDQLPPKFTQGGWVMYFSLFLLAALIWLATGFYKVEPDEQGVVLRFGKWVRSETPGLHYHLPTPIETALTPKVTFVHRTEIGYRSAPETRSRFGARSSGTTQTKQQDIQSESLMLTGDENIIKINFAVLWLIDDAGKFLFKIRDPQRVVKLASESAMREVIGRTGLISALTEGRQSIAISVQKVLQKMLDDYQTGIEVTKVDIQDASPPEAVIDSFNDVQRARADLVRLRNEAEAYRNKIVPEARGKATQIIQDSEAYRARVMNVAQGEASRFKAVLNAYKKTPAPVRDRMYLEMMEELLADQPKMILENKGGGAVPYLPLKELAPKSSQSK